MARCSVGRDARDGDGARASPQRLLLVRLSAIGDIIFASPLIASARRAHPRAHIAWLVQPECAPLLAHHPDLDQVIEWPLPRWRRLWRERRLFGLVAEVIVAVKALRACRFDLAIDLQGLLKSALPVRWSGAPERIGLGTREGGQWLMTQRIERGPNSDWISSEYRHLASSLGWPSDDFRLRVSPGREAELAAEALIAAHGLDAGYAVICPFTTRPQKHWIDARWSALAARIHARFGLPTLMLGGPGDREAAQRISRGPLVDLVGATSLLSAAALIRRARCVVGVDTGLSHMGIAFERPTVLLFGSTCPYTETGSAAARVLYHPRHCSPCRRRPICDGAFTCMREIQLDEVMATLVELLERDRSEQTSRADQADRADRPDQADQADPSVGRASG
ncbi:glycosyltransferase family 9 protein [Halochromatium salexigens]|uniref:Lipopolysaccharide heptosyltransferase n=1 Tax=Halochromatium salexigens TaxID=49447 RepID=A0AAJ0UF59_HALSE|nr:glycosyltransferase family 9 protein [Halochromatium salexigens]MBK5930312.1 lipopolysaccharide heptosyltransferase [Halochromatium salexigens]